MDDGLISFLIGLKTSIILGSYVGYSDYEAIFEVFLALAGAIPAIRGICFWWGEGGRKKRGVAP